MLVFKKTLVKVQDDLDFCVEQNRMLVDKYGELNSIIKTKTSFIKDLQKEHKDLVEKIQKLGEDVEEKTKKIEDSPSRCLLASIIGQLKEIK